MQNDKDFFHKVELFILRLALFVFFALGIFIILFLGTYHAYEFLKWVIAH